MGSFDKKSERLWNILKKFSEDERSQLIQQRDEAIKIIRDLDDEMSNKIIYDSSEDEIGCRSCCDVLSYDAHDENCPYSRAKKFLSSLDKSS